MLSAFPPFIFMKSSISLSTHSDLAERGEHTTIRFLDIDKAWYICLGKLPALSSSVSLKIGRRFFGRFLPFNVVGK